MRTLLGGGVVGFYDPTTEELVVRGTSLSPYVRITMAHELTHALDDQHFDLDRPEHEEARDETGYGFSSLVEGSASRVEDAYRSELSADDQASALAEETSIAGSVDPTGIPFALVEEIISPYLDGAAFVEALVDEGGQAELDGAFAAPPTTSEQVLEPDAYLAGEQRVEVPAPSVPAEVVDQGVVGQRLVRSILGGLGGGLGGLGAELDPEASEAAAGWGGDWAVTWRDGDRSCATVALVGDAADDTAALFDAFTEWATDLPDATVTAGAAEADPFTVQSCAG
jgi:hypothetical protein